ncbi:tyrosyl-tRNA synthetase, partial [Candidatus Termititenax persephonae]
AAENFKNVFAHNGAPDDITALRAQDFCGLPLAKLLTATGLSASNGEAKRDIQAGAVKINGQKAADPQTVIVAEQAGPAEAELIIQVGKRKFVKLN